VWIVNKGARLWTRDRGGEGIFSAQWLDGRTLSTVSRGGNVEFRPKLLRGGRGTGNSW
jgi:hypothetical protein